MKSEHRGYHDDSWTVRAFRVSKIFYYIYILIGLYYSV